MILKLYRKARTLRRALHPLLGDSKGLDLIEYALAMVLLAGAAAAGVGSVALKINHAFTLIGTKLSSYTS
jgi:Flp pilus assembly pilin Flp